MAKIALDGRWRFYWNISLKKQKSLQHPTWRLVTDALDLKLNFFAVPSAESLKKKKKKILEKIIVFHFKSSKYH